MSTGRNLRTFPKMVKWFTPLLLVRAAFRDIVAHLFGQYADQRVTQHLSDPIPEDPDQQKQFAKRYDYSSEAIGEDPFWVDYAADLGDGFDPTYAVAYMLAAGNLNDTTDPDTGRIQGIRDLPDGNELRHGRIMIMGGDQVYPWPSREEYESRLCTPYKLAMPELPADPATGQTPEAERDLFAIPGNHDWYDGLASFDDLFCGARSGQSGRQSKRIGGLQTRQHRSYFAIKLPHDWWIWGADIQLNKYLDNGQLEYFRTVSKQMGPQDKFILCAAQPSWIYFGTAQEKYARENLRNLIDIPLQRGAKLCAILSGDTHHYSRYNESEKLGNFNLITSGGGGAYTHGTHQLKPEINFKWVGEGVSFKLNKLLKPGKASADGEPTSRQTKKPACYPSKPASRRLAWGNTAFAFRNKMFCFAIGLIYWMLTWTFSELNTADAVIRIQIPETFEITRGVDLKSFPLAFDALEDTEEPEPVEFFIERTKDFQNWTLVMGRVFVEELNAPGGMLSNFFPAVLNLVKYGIQLLMIGLGHSPGASVFLLGTWYVFFAIADTKRVDAGRVWNKRVLGTVHFLTHLFWMWVLYCSLIYINHSYLKDIFYELAGPDNFLLFLPKELWPDLIYPLEMIPLGGLIGGFIFGVYLFGTHLLAKIHSDWTFSAQRTTGYKNFLRMCFEPDKLTIYPIGLDFVPSRRGWRWSKNPAPGRPKVEPRSALKPHLIEGPIVIRASEVRNFPRD